MGDRMKGLQKRYAVERLDGKPLKGGGALVLEFGDPVAWSAIAEFADTVRASGYHRLANDIERELAWQEDGSYRLGSGPGTPGLGERGGSG